MPPKKVVEEAPKTLLLGRAKNHLSMGIVGLPNVGKSLTFNFLSKSSAPSDNYMFCTIEPNVARAPIEDERFDWLCDLYKPKSRVPTTLEIIDIAGLVKGASEGLGKGNAFLSNIQMVDGIFHVVRIFDDVEVVHCEGDVDPVRDMKIINDELVIKDMQLVKNRLADAQNAVAKGIDKMRKNEIPILEKAIALLEEDKHIRHGTWNSEEIILLNQLNLFTAKPMVYLLNMNESEYIRQRAKGLRQAIEWIQANSPNDPIIPYCASLEYRICLLTKEQKEAELAAAKCHSQFRRIIETGYHTIHLIHYFTAGEDEVRCWTIREGTNAPDAGAVIHTDFRDHFIYVDVMKYSDLFELKSEKAVHDAGKVTQCGKTYIVQDGDILHFKSAARAGGKRK